MRLRRLVAVDLVVLVPGLLRQSMLDMAERE
jgi:hypothetical protein